MRRVIRKCIRHSADGVELAVDLNADVAVNVRGWEPPSPAPEEVPADEPRDTDQQEGKEP